MVQAQTQHGVLPEASSDEAARQEFVVAYRRHVQTQLLPGNRKIYDNRVELEFIRGHNRPPKNRHEVRRVMEADPFYQMYGSLLFTSQELMWDAVGSSVERQLPDLIKKAKNANGTGGTLRLDPDFKTPRYLAAIDHRSMPGSYCQELAEDDVYAGAVYDRGAYMYAMGLKGPLHDDLGVKLCEYIGERHPDIKPSRILDMGCTVGHSTIPFVDTYPEADVQAIDAAAALLRYAHARSELLGKKVHYSQQNAEHTDFDDGSFDMVVSHVLMHETSLKAMKNILRECHRLLRPGGWMFHVEVPFRYADLDPYWQFLRDWSTRGNHEPFWGTINELDLEKVVTEAGFPKESFFQRYQQSSFGQEHFKGGAYSGGQWFLYGARKA